LAPAALFVKRARREVVFWMAFGILALVLSFGGNTFLYKVAYLLVPGFGSVRNQERIIYLFSFAVSVLAGYGALVLVQPLVRPVRKGFRSFVQGLAWAGVALLAMTALWYLGYLQSLQQAVEVNLFDGLLRHHILLLLVLGGTIVLLGLRLSGKARRHWLIGLALGLIWLNLFTVNWQFNLAEPANGEPGVSGAKGPFPETGLVAFLKDQPGIFRFSSAGLLPGGASAGIVYELEDITGNTPLRLEAFQQFENRVGSWRRWQLLNVEYVLSSRDIDGPGLERVYEEGTVKVYRVGDPLPRAWMVHDSVIADDEQAFDLLDAREFDPRALAVLPPESAEFFLSGPGGLGNGVWVADVRPGQMEIDVSSVKDGLLVVSQPFYPGWRASVDGEPTPIFRVDYLLQGIPMQAGTHRVELSYHLSPFPAIVSLVALAGCVVGLILCLRRR
jgi:hypothetical protein